jgi:hypothetical protein
MAALGGHTEIVRLLIQDPRVNITLTEALRLSRHVPPNTITEIRSILGLEYPLRWANDHNVINQLTGVSEFLGLYNALYLVEQGLLSACKRGNIHVVNDLLHRFDNIISPDVLDDCLREAINARHDDIVQLLQPGLHY